jgi:RNA-directed DNA polymerase
MHGHEKSDPAVVAVKPANKDGRPSAEWVERRTGAEGNAGQRNTHRAQNRERVTHALDRVRNAARQKKPERFTAPLRANDDETPDPREFRLEGAEG